MKKRLACIFSVLVCALAVCLLPALSMAQEPVLTETTLPGYIVPLNASKARMDELLESWGAVQMKNDAGVYYVSEHFSGRLSITCFAAYGATPVVNDISYCVDDPDGSLYNDLLARFDSDYSTGRLGETVCEYIGVSETAWYVSLDSKPAVLSLTRTDTQTTLRITSPGSDKEKYLNGAVHNIPEAKFQAPGMRMIEDFYMPDGTASLIPTEEYLPGYFVPFRHNGQQRHALFSSLGLTYVEIATGELQLYSDEAAKTFSMGGLTGEYYIWLTYPANNNPAYVSGYTYFTGDPEGAGYTGMRAWFDENVGPTPFSDATGQKVSDWLRFGDGDAYAIYRLTLKKSATVLAAISHTDGITAVDVRMIPFEEKDNYATLFGQDDESTVSLPIVPLQVNAPAESCTDETDRIKEDMVEDSHQVLDGFMNGN